MPSIHERERQTALNSADAETAAAFSESWNRKSASVYTREQFLDWLAPVDPTELRGKEVLELGFGNGSLLYHMASFAPGRLAGVELGDTLDVAKQVLLEAAPPETKVELHRADLTRVDLGPFDFVYCIGVLHHLAEPKAGFRSVLKHTRPGGRFHGWVYAYEGNAAVRYLVEPLRRITSRLPWWLTKYFVALPLVVPFFVYAKLLRLVLRDPKETDRLPGLPLVSYSLWIAEREFGFFHHVAFDQLVTPRTVYLRRDEIQSWLADPDVEPESTYVIFRNGNSWKFGGRKK
jgi:SAM-dependent methyltransferase